jgi:hypothetical protein
MLDPCGRSLEQRCTSLPAGRSVPRGAAPPAAGAAGASRFPLPDENRDGSNASRRAARRPRPIERAADVELAAGWALASLFMAARELAFLAMLGGAIVLRPLWLAVRFVALIVGLAALDVADPALILLASFVERRQTSKVSPHTAEEYARQLIAEAIIELGRGARERRARSRLASWN